MPTTGSPATKQVTAEDQFTDWLEFDGSVRQFNVSVFGTFSAVVTVQRRLGLDDADIKDVKIYTTQAEEIGTLIENGVQYRIGVKTGEFTSGTIELRLSY